MIDPLLVVPILLIIFISTLLRSTFGFGNALIAMPLLVLVIGTKAAAPLVAVCGVVIAIAMLFRKWHLLNLKDTLYLLLTSLAGLPLGLIFLKTAPEDIAKLLLGLILIGFGLYNLAGLRIPEIKSQYLVIPFGIVAGMFGGAYNANGPPVVIYGVMRGWDKDRFRATLQGYFLVSNIAIVIGHATTGILTRGVLIYFLISIPIAVLAVLLGDRIVHNIPEDKYNLVFNIFLLTAGVLMFV